MDCKCKLKNDETWELGDEFLFITKGDDGYFLISTWEPEHQTLTSYDDNVTICVKIFYCPICGDKLE